MTAAPPPAEPSLQKRLRAIITFEDRVQTTLFQAAARIDADAKRIEELQEALDAAMRAFGAEERESHKQANRAEKAERAAAASDLAYAGLARDHEEQKEAALEMQRENAVLAEQNFAMNKTIAEQRCELAEARALLLEWKGVESAPFGEMVLLWHRAWRHAFPGQVVNNETGDCVLASPTPEYQVSPHFATHWTALTKPKPAAALKEG